MSKTTIGDYILTRLIELGVNDIFGVPGDYNLSFLDHIVENKSLKWVGNCNELNAAYAADAYARIKGISAIVTTFGVGELSAINGIAGSFAEYVPVVHIVGAPSTVIQKTGCLMHHNIQPSDFKSFIQMFEKISADMAVILTPATAAAEIDRVLETCWIKKQPVYISLPSDMVQVTINSPKKPLKLDYPRSDKGAVKEAVTRIAALVRAAKKPVILGDICAIRHPMTPLLHELLDKTGIPFATMNMGKGIINESHLNFLGSYNGDYSSPGVQERVEGSDCILSFGSLMSDFNTGGFTSKIGADATIEIHSHYVKVKHALYPNVYFNAILPELIKSLHGYHCTEKVHHPEALVCKPTNKKITQKYFWNRMTDFFKPKDILIGETGTSMFGLAETKVPDHASVIIQTLWASIGYSVGAVLGAALASQKRRTILFVGDGSFQLTAQEISSVLRHKLSPIVFLLNNDGYTIERAIHGAKMSYNDIQPWKYDKLPSIFGDNAYTASASTEKELEDVLKKLPKHNKQLCFIEVKMDRDDCPESLRKLGRACEQKNDGRLK